MPIAGTRAAQYAGWWTGKPRMSTTINAELNRGSPWIIQPARYYQDNPVTGYQFGSYGGLVSSTNAQIDTTGLSNSANYTTAITIKFGSSYLATAPSGSAGAIWYDRFRSAGTDYFPNMGISKGSGSNYTLSIGTIDSGGSINITGFDSSLRNTWLTFIMAVSTSSSSFAGWSGSGTGTQYVRIAIVNTQTGRLNQPISDYAIGGTTITKDFSQNWYLDSSGSSSYAYQPFWYTDNAEWNLYARTDWDLASIWHGWNVVDPALYYNQLSGVAMSPTVAGLTSTAMVQFTGSGSRTPGDDGFTFTIGGNGSRVPSNTAYFTDTNQSTSTNSPALVSF